MSRDGGRETCEKKRNNIEVSGTAKSLGSPPQLWKFYFAGPPNLPHETESSLAEDNAPELRRRGSAIRRLS